MGSRAEKTALFEAIAVMGKAFASPTRLELLDLLAQAPRTVDELARAGEQSVANTSQHLQALYAAGLVTRTREGTSVRYSLAGDEVLELWLALRATSASRLAEVERAARDYLGDDVEAIGRDELRERMRRGEVLLVDVRPGEEYEAGHIEGARSIPIDELDERLAGMPADREIVAYCRGPFCENALRRRRSVRRSRLSRWSRRPTPSSTTTPITAPGSPPRSNALSSPMPSSSVKIRNPTRAPAIPRTTVAMNPVLSLPGMIARPMKPARMPRMIAPITGPSPGWLVAPTYPSSA